jgi:hypothetical protein
LRRRRWLIRKSDASVGEALLERMADAETRERVVLCTMRWARSSKTEDCRSRVSLSSGLW